MKIISSKLFCAYKVSCAAWGNWIHLNRKLFAKSFLSDMGAMVHHLNRKLLVNSFLFGM